MSTHYKIKIIYIYICGKHIWNLAINQKKNILSVDGLAPTGNELSADQMIYTKHTVYPKKCAHSFVVLCFVVVMQSFIMNSHEVFIHIHQGCFAGTGAIVRLPQCQRSKPGGYWKISQCITTTKHSKAKTVCIFLGIYCTQCDVVMIWSTFTKIQQTPIACLQGQGLGVFCELKV